MLSLKTIAILSLPGVLLAGSRIFGPSADLLAKGDAVLERILPAKLNAILVTAMDFLTASDIVWEAPDHRREQDLINPATGLPMMGAVDIAGNPYGSSDGHAADWEDGF